MGNCTALKVFLSYVSLLCVCFSTFTLLGVGRSSGAVKQRGWTEQQETEVRQLFERFRNSPGL